MFWKRDTIENPEMKILNFSRPTSKEIFARIKLDELEKYYKQAVELNLPFNNQFLDEIVNLILSENNIPLYDYNEVCDYMTKYSKSVGKTWGWYTVSQVWSGSNNIQYPEHFGESLELHINNRTGTQTVENRREMKQYLQMIPMNELDKIFKIKESLKEIPFLRNNNSFEPTFYVSEVHSTRVGNRVIEEPITNPTVYDPFLLLTFFNCTRSYVIGVWDEPGFSGQALKK